MYYILPEGLKIESNEPVYCTVYSRVGCFGKFFISLDKKVPALSE